MTDRDRDRDEELLKARRLDELLREQLTSSAIQKIRDWDPDNTDITDALSEMSDLLRDIIAGQSYAQQTRLDIKAMLGGASVAVVLLLGLILWRVW